MSKKDYPNFKERVPVQEILEMWDNAESMSNMNLMKKIEKFEVVPNDFSGSRFGHDSIRIEGQIDFIKAVLKMLTPIKNYTDCNFEKTLEIFMFTIKKGQVVPFKESDKENFERYCVYLRLKQTKSKVL